MERRSFLNLSFASLLATPAVGQGGRLFGVPDSVAGPTTGARDSLVLSVERLKLGMGSEASALLVSTANVWADVMTDDRSRAEFESNPSAFLERRGVPREVASRSPADIALLRVAASTTGREFIARGDMRGYITFLRDSGLGVDFKSEVSMKLRAILLENQEELRAIVRREMEKLRQEQGDLGALDAEFSRLSATVAVRASDNALNDDSNTLVVAAAVLVIVALGAIVALAISVVATVVIALTFGALTVAVVATEIALSASGDDGVNGVSVAKHSHAVANTAHRLNAYGKAYDAFQKAAKAAQLAGAPNASLELIKDFVAEEAVTIISVCEELGLIKLDPDQRESVMKQAIDQCHRTMGLAT